MNPFYIFITLVAGALAPTQAGINAELSTYLRSTILAALVSFAVGTAALLAYAFLIRTGWPPASALARAPWWAWTGGFCGAFLVAATVAAAPRLGAASMIGFFIAGQMLASLLLDHYGVVGFEVRALTPVRVLGAVLLVAGVVLIRKF
ncbi:MAG: DMT family transporter [Desulfovibrionales bacterium]